MKFILCPLIMHALPSKFVHPQDMETLISSN